MRGSTKLHDSQGQFIILEWGDDETTKQGVIRFTASDGRVGREISVSEIFRDAKMHECWPPKES